MRFFIECILDELGRLLSDLKTCIIIILGPIILTFLFCSIYVNHSVVNIPIAIIDKDNSSLSRNIIEGFRSSDKFDIKMYLDSEDKINNNFNNDNIVAAVVVPSGYMKDVTQKTSSSVLIIINGSNMIMSNSVMTSALEIIQTYSTGTTLKYLQTSGVLPQNAASIAMPINFRTRIWYNPTFNYLTFMIFGLIGAAIQQICFLYTANSMIASRNKSKTKGELIERIISTLGVQYIINFLSFTICLTIAIGIYKVPLRGNPIDIAILILCFIPSILSLGIFLSIICKNELEATQLSMLVAVPSFLVSGFTWPTYMMPKFLQLFASVLPLTYFVTPLRKLALMGAPINYVLKDIIILIGISVVFLPLSVFAYLRKCKEIKKA